MKTEHGTCRALKIAVVAAAVALTQSGLIAQSVTIPDPNLKAAIRAALQKPEGEITVADMESLTELTATSENISNLTGLEKATNLTELSFESDRVSDISPLASLTNLTELRMLGHSDGHFSDISPLAGLTNLIVLSLGSDLIADISPLVGLINLTELSLAHDKVSDISPLAGLTNLTILNLGSCCVSDLSPLAELTDLTVLSVTVNWTSDLSPLVDLTNLTELRLWGDSEVSDISPLAGMTDLKELSMWGESQISDISPLAGMTDLTVLVLPENQISDISPLTGLTKLTELYLSNNEITDVSPLAGLTDLEMLKLHYNQITDIGPLAGLTNLRDWCGWGCDSGLDISHNYIDITLGSPARQVIDSLNAIEGLTVEFEPQDDPDAPQPPEPIDPQIVIGGTSGGAGWFFSDWFGYYMPLAPWLLHMEHGYLYYYRESTNASMYVYDEAMDAWWWTSEDVYPFIYVFNPPADNGGTDIEDAWLWCFEGERDPRVFGVVTGADAGDFLFFGP